MIAITGATGFVGARLLQRLLGSGERVRVLGRRKLDRPEIEYFHWEASDPAAPAGAFEKCDAVVHLAGEPVAQRWNDEVKRRIRSSRVDGTRSIVRALTSAGTPPRCLICASATGYYGDRGEETLTESSKPGSGFLSEVCIEWEQAAREAERVGARVVSVRTGIVLGAGGALKQMLTPFRMGVGGPLGSGRQWMSWIHIEDLVNLILFAIREPKLSGPLNAVSPAPVRNSEFTKALAAAVHRPAFLPVPKFGLQVMFGEMAEVLLASQRVLPDGATKAGFKFQFDQIAPALNSAVQERFL